MAAIEVTNVSKQYGMVKAVDDVSFAIEKGEIFGIIGANGAGKTTLLEMMMGVRKPASGNIKVLTLDTISQVDEVKERIGILLQEASVYPKIKVREVLELFGTYYRKSVDVGDMLQKLELMPYENSFVKKLSGGLRQRVLLALAFINDPDIVILDEPTTGLDPEVRAMIWRHILDFRKEGGTVVLSTHYMNEVSKYCNRVLILKEGKVVLADTPANLVEALDSDNASLDDVYMKYATLG